MDSIVIGRASQIKEMKSALVSNKAEMVALIGRRRVGKTYLVRQVYKEEIIFELTGLQYGSKPEQLQNFTLSLSRYFPDYPIEKVPTSWLEGFHLLTQAITSVNKKEKAVIFLDELPWLGTKRSGFIKGLGYFWNSWASKENIVLAVCGSAASWMIDKIINDKGGLHNRVTRLLFLPPFTLAETEAYCVARKIRLNRYQILQIYMTMGGIPMYLDQLKPGLSAIQNIQQICFSETGYLRNEYERLFASLFDNYQNHMMIIKALAKKRKGLTRQEIIKTTSFKDGGMLSKLLEELTQSGFIKVYGAYGKRIKESLYRLIDFYSFFYLTFIVPLGKGSQMNFTKLSDLPKWKSWSGYTFENVCFLHIDTIRKALGISGVASSISSFIAKPKDGLPGTQIDLLVDRSDQSINLCEIKHSISDYKVTKKDAENIQNKKRIFNYHTKTKKHIFITLITTMGIVENDHRVNYIDQVVVLDDLFKE